ncbi:barstar family protein [Zooshikella sp. RANM57]|uniref:barstar family protein n=1 Tax=Zooshikella sp. RANM57 TaxID=3425863 RepID=UPI003D6EA13B
MSMIKEFPPKELGCWQNLSSNDKEEWLQKACDRFFHDESYVIQSEANRTIEIDGKLIRDPLDFFCLFGEAVNGPGGYFGKCPHSFDDCLFEKFGLEFPSTIIWENYSATKKILPNFCKDIVDAMRTVHDRQSWYDGDKQAIQLVIKDNG